MLLRHWQVCGVLLLVGLLGVVFAQSTDSPKGGDTKEVAFTGKAIHVLLKNQMQLQGRKSTYLFMEQPQIKVFGNTSFVVGRSIEHSTQVWVPLSEVAAIEEFADVKEMGKIYSLPRPVDK